MARVFSRKTREEQLADQKGLCAWCLRPLRLEDAHGDHQVSVANGGPTDRWNVQMLHRVPCHREKTALIDPLRQWQREFVFAHDAHEEQVFLLQAPVGAGKTRAGIAAFQMWRRHHPDAICVVIGPSVEIIRGWAREALAFGKVGVKALDRSERKIRTRLGERELLSVESNPPSDLVFWLATYGSLGGLRGKLSQLCQVRPVFVILDEVHHTRHEDENGWGSYLDEAFGRARRLLVTTATPYRTDGEVIGFLKGKYEDGQALADYRLTLEEAVRDGLCARAEFVHWDGTAKWKYIDKDEESGRIADEDTADRALHVAIQDADYQDREIGEGNRLLSYKRMYENAAATGLILAGDIQQARQIAKRWPNAIAATSDNAEAHRTIEAFRNRTLKKDWLVAVGMVSEGCDIPHVKVIVWLTKTRTSNDFVQKVGRGIRAIEPSATLAIVLPAHPEYQRMAKEWLHLQGPPLRESEVEDRDHQDRNDPEMWFGRGVDDIAPVSFVEDSEAFSLDGEVAAVAERANQPVAVVHKVLEAFRGRAEPEPVRHEDIDPNSRHIELRAACKSLIATIGKRSWHSSFFNQYANVNIYSRKEARLLSESKPWRELEAYNESELESLYRVLVDMKKKYV